jgi:hypothetical protein
MSFIHRFFNGRTDVHQSIHAHHLADHSAEAVADGDQQVHHRGRPHCQGKLLRLCHLTSLLHRSSHILRAFSHSLQTFLDWYSLNSYLHLYVLKVYHGSNRSTSIKDLKSVDIVLTSYAVRDWYHTCCARQLCNKQHTVIAVFIFYMLPSKSHTLVIANRRLFLSAYTWTLCTSLSLSLSLSLSPNIPHTPIPVPIPFFAPALNRSWKQNIAKPLRAQRSRAASAIKSSIQTSSECTGIPSYILALYLLLLCLALPCLALPCLALPCLALPCLALPCLALPCLDLT